LELVGDGRILRVGAIVRREEALSWLETIGVGAQHIVAMFGGTFVFPLITLGRTRTWRS
jgi:xanthine/uracil permease